MRELEISDPQFQQGTSSTHLGKREWRIHAGRQDEVHLGGQMVQQKGKRVMDGFGSYDLVIVQNEDKGFLVIGSPHEEIVDQ